MRAAGREEKRFVGDRSMEGRRKARHVSGWPDQTLWQNVCIGIASAAQTLCQESSKFYQSIEC